MAIEAVINAKAKDIGGFSVRRALPAIERRMIGPFIFLDQIGPAAIPAGQGLDVRPHPHIGLSTMTYLYDGAIMHRDTTAPLAPDDGWRPIFEHVLALGAKDLTHAVELADRLGVEVPMAQYAAGHLAEALGLDPSDGRDPISRHPDPEETTA